MSVVQRMSIELEARRLIGRARKVNRMAASWRGERLCLPCRLHLCRIPAWTLRAACVGGLVLDAWILAHVI